MGPCKKKTILLCAVTFILWLTKLCQIYFYDCGMGWENYIRTTDIKNIPHP